jgi:two-component system chemotaxis response regulator CheY
MCEAERHQGSAGKLETRKVWGPVVKQCLIVDDSRVIRKVARKILEEMRFVIDEAEDASSALEQCRRTMPDAILFDWNMPNAPGSEFLRALRREKDGRKPIVVVCTTENDVVQITEAVSAGANDYIMKPFDYHALKAKFSSAGLI